MTDYISREAIYNKTAEWEAQALAQVGRHMHDDDPAEWRRWFTILTERSAFKHDVCDAPAADVAPVRHGYWDSDGHTVACSNCHTLNLHQRAWEYCPNCGAKMDGGTNDEFD